MPTVNFNILILVTTFVIPDLFCHECFRSYHNQSYQYVPNSIHSRYLFKIFINNYMINLNIIRWKADVKFDTLLNMSHKIKKGRVGYNYQRY